MRRINELFYSLQGEGYHTGTPAVFIRFSGCNLQCPFCDTEFESGTEMSDDQIIDAVRALAEPPLIVLTGGEPSLQVDAALLERLHEAFPDTIIAMETNGTRPVPRGIDWVTCSPKNEHYRLHEANEVKLVYPGTIDPESIDIRANHYFLQPCALPDSEQTKANQVATIEYILCHPRWRLSLQTHKVLGIR